MSIKAKEILKNSATALLFGCLVSLLIYYLPLGSNIRRPTFGFVWAAGDASPTASEYNVLLRRMLLQMRFYFANGTELDIPVLFPLMTALGPEGYPLPEYHGEIDATWLIAIGATLKAYGIETPGDAVATMEICENVSVKVHLVSGDMTTDMGRYDFLNNTWHMWFNQTQTSISGSTLYSIRPPKTGYFIEGDKPMVPTWQINVSELCQMLPDTGTATIEFRSSLESSVDYDVALGSETRTGNEELGWEGILGTYLLQIDQGRILSVKYDFISAFMSLKIQK